MSTTLRERAAWLLCLAALTGAPALAVAQHTNAAAVAKPFTLQIRYGANANPDTTATAKPRRLEFTVAARDAGRFATRDARLDYSISAGTGGDLSLSIDFIYATASGSRTVKTQLLLPRRQWQRVAFDSADEAPAGEVYVRVDPN